jgi:biopolymer transport protein ExbD
MSHTSIWVPVVTLFLLPSGMLRAQVAELDKLEGLSIPLFLLSASTGQEAQADLKLPTASEIRKPDTLERKEETTTLDVLHRKQSTSLQCPFHAGGGRCVNDTHWVIWIGTTEYSLATIVDQLRIQADASLEEEVDPVVGVRLSARRVVLRADQTAPWGYLNRIIAACATSKIYKIAVAARSGEIEGRFECWLPRAMPLDTRAGQASREASVPAEIRIAMFWDETQQATIRQWKDRRIESDEDLLAQMKEARDGWVLEKQPGVPLTIDAAANVPWSDIVHVINLSRIAHVDNVEFVHGAE